MPRAGRNTASRSPAVREQAAASTGTSGTLKSGREVTGDRRLFGRFLEVAAELIAHGREQLVLEFCAAARAEALVERGGEHRCGDALVDPRFDRPAPFA